MKKVILPVLAILVLVGCGKKEQVKEQLAQVKVKTVQSSLNSVPVQLPAQLKGKQDILVIPQVSALLNQVLVQEGEVVTKGQRMFVLDETEYRSIYDNAIAQLRTAELEEEAKKELLSKNIISEHEYKVAKNTLESAKANVRNAKTNLDRCVITAPSNGVVGNINYRQGALVNPQISNPLTVVSDNHIVYAYISINEKVYNNLMMKAEGNKERLLSMLPPAELILSNDSVYDIKGHVETMSGIIDPNTGALSVRVAFDNPKGILAAGGSATLQMSFDWQSIVIPRIATYEIQDKTYLYQVHATDSAAIINSIIVDTYRLNDKEYIVFNGLNSGDTIVVEGVKKLANNQHIEMLWN